MAESRDSPVDWRHWMPRYPGTSAADESKVNNRSTNSFADYRTHLVKCKCYRRFDSAKYLAQVDGMRYAVCGTKSSATVISPATNATDCWSCLSEPFAAPYNANNQAVYGPLFGCTTCQVFWCRTVHAMWNTILDPRGEPTPASLDSWFALSDPDDEILTPGKDASMDRLPFPVTAKQAASMMERMMMGGAAQSLLMDVVVRKLEDIANDNSPRTPINQEDPEDDSLPAQLSMLRLAAECSPRVAELLDKVESDRTNLDLGDGPRSFLVQIARNAALSPRYVGSDPRGGYVDFVEFTFDNPVVIAEGIFNAAQFAATAAIRTRLVNATILHYLSNAVYTPLAIGNEALKKPTGHGAAAYLKRIQDPEHRYVSLQRLHHLITLVRAPDHLVWRFASDIATACNFIATLTSQQIVAKIRSIQEFAAELASDDP